MPLEIVDYIHQWYKCFNRTEKLKNDYTWACMCKETKLNVPKLVEHKYMREEFIDGRFFLSCNSNGTWQRNKRVLPWKCQR